MPAPRVTVPSHLIAAFCRRWKVNELAFFGSVMGDDFEPDSDVDALMTFDAGGKLRGIVSPRPKRCCRRPMTSTAP